MLDLDPIKARLDKAAKVTPLEEWKIVEIEIGERCQQWWDDFNRHQENNADDNYEPHEAEDCPNGECEIRVWTGGFLTIDDDDYWYPHPHMAEFWARSGRDIAALIEEVERVRAENWIQSQQIERLSQELQLWESDKCVHSDLTEKLKRLRECCETGIAIAHNHKSEWNDAINWGDLHCVNAELVSSFDGDTSFRVWVEEAEPGASELIRFIGEHLARHGWGSVEVVTEW